MSETASIGKAVGYLKDFWFIVAFVTTLIVGWTNINSNLKYQESRITALETQSKAFNVTLTQMASDISYIRGKLEGK